MTYNPSGYEKMCQPCNIASDMRSGSETYHLGETIKPVVLMFVFNNLLMVIFTVQSGE